MIEAPAMDSHTVQRITLQLSRDPDAPGAARRALDSIDHGLDYEREYSVKLLMSELVSNAVKYGSDGPVIVEIESTAGCVRVEVDDSGPAFIPVPRELELDVPGGWGFVLVDELASRWGSSPRSASFWFEIDAA